MIFRSQQFHQGKIAALRVQLCGHVIFLEHSVKTEAEQYKSYCTTSWTECKRLHYFRRHLKTFLFAASY